MEPFSAAQLSPAALQLAVAIKPWKLAASQGLQEPDPADLLAERYVPLDNQPALIDTGKTQEYQLLQLAGGSLRVMQEASRCFGKN